VEAVAGDHNRLHSNAFADLLREFDCAALMSGIPTWWVLFVFLPTLAMITSGYGI
jgi:hypothetical protein